MNRFSQSLVGGILGVLLGLGSASVVPALKKALLPAAPAQAMRTYLCDENSVRWQVDATYGSIESHFFTCSDETVLTFVSLERESTVMAATDREQILRGTSDSFQLGPVLQRTPLGTGDLVEFSLPVNLGAGPTTQPWTWAYMDVSGRYLRLLYGPSKDHIVELLATNPCHTW